MRLSPHRWRHHVLHLVHHPRVSMSLKAAVAATLAWVIALRVPGPASEYPFYAPLGAVVAVYPTVARSLREATQSVVAIALGVSLAVLADSTFGLGAWVVAVVVLLGVLLGGLPWLGNQRSYVATSGLFVLVIGQSHELDCAASYAGLFLLGAVIALAVNAAFPSLPVHRMDNTHGALRTPHLPGRPLRRGPGRRRTPDRSGTGTSGTDRPHVGRAGGGPRRARGHPRQPSRPARARRRRAAL